MWSAGCGLGSKAWCSCVFRWMRTRALPIPVGYLPIGWAREHVTDMWLYWRIQPWCHWRRNGGAAGLGNGVGAGATMPRLAAEGGETILSRTIWNWWFFPWHRVHCHMPSVDAGASPSLPPSTAAQEMDFLCFWPRVFDRRGRRGEGSEC